MHANRKTAYINGKIFTSDRENLHAEAMTVENGRITWVGAQADLPAGPYDETVDLQGRRVLPGFVDAHEHPVMLADFSKKISSLPPKVNSIEELKQAIRDVREQQGPGKWIEGWGYDEGKLAEKRSPYPLRSGRGVQRLPRVHHPHLRPYPLCEQQGPGDGGHHQGHPRPPGRPD